MAVLFIPLILLISWNNGRVTKILSLKPLEYLGEVSYAVYITHIPILYTLREILKQQNYQFDINSVFWIYLAVLIMVSMLFYQFVEKPLRDLIKKVNIR
jgi:peptidoglycan/LPS O-acetylase OafA/YrhL